jgi:metal-dependent amidase/aminoacylase/carboxypeptidase family protein
MDALPMPGETRLDFASEIPGRMHACGHDAHTAMLVQAVHLSHRQRDELPGTVKFMFQPGEEGRSCVVEAERLPVHVVRLLPALLGISDKPYRPTT